MKLVIEVVEIKGNCPVYKSGDKIILDHGYKVDLKKTDHICLHSLASLLPYYNALARKVSPVDMGLARSGKDAYVQCLDPMKYTGGGTVTFRISRKRV